MIKGKSGADDVPFDNRYYEFADILNQIPDISWANQYPPSAQCDNVRSIFARSGSSVSLLSLGDHDTSQHDLQTLGGNMTLMNALSPSQSRHSNVNIISNGSDFEPISRRNTLVSPLDWDNHNTEFHTDMYKLQQSRSISSTSLSLNRNISNSNMTDTIAVAKAITMDQDENQDDDGDDDSFDVTDEDNDDELMDSKRKKTDGSSKRRSTNCSSKDANLYTMDSKAKEKNRYHAKNTRMRKKNLIDSMRDKVKVLSSCYEATQNEMKRQSYELSEKVNLRTNHITTFFRLRASGERCPLLWNEVLDSNFVLTLPITPYRSFPPHQVIDNYRYIVGLDALISDTASLFVMIQSLGDQRENKNGFIQAEYKLDWDNMIVDGNIFMCKWSLHTTNATSKGARHEVFKHGMVQLIFASNSNKILSINMTHDVMSFMQELRRCSGSCDFQLIPNTYNIACEDSPEMRLIVEYNEENILLSKIAYVNNTLSDIFGTVQLNDHSVKAICYSEKQNLEVITSCIQLAVAQCASVDTISLCNDEGTKIVVNAKFFPLYKINQSVNAADSDIISHVLIVMDPLTLKGTAGLRGVVSMIVTEEGQSTYSNFTDTSVSTASKIINKLEKRNNHKTSRYNAVSQVNTNGSGSDT